MRVELRYFEDCPNWRIAEGHLQDLAREIGFEVIGRRVETAEEAEALEFRGSPSIVVDERDAFSVGDQPVGLSCRIYQTPHGPAGSPTVDQLRAVLSEAIGRRRPHGSGPDEPPGRKGQDA